MGKSLIPQSLTRALRSAASAETQAVAIYEAECYWVRHPTHGALLRKILEEEKEHAHFIQKYVKSHALESAMNRVVGWILGSLLIALPWKWFFRFQSWAEREAEKTYSKALQVLDETVKDGSSSALRVGLEEAADSERNHSETFRRLV